jgi:hypothetical protein
LIYSVGAGRNGTFQEATKTAESLSSKNPLNDSWSLRGDREQNDFGVPELITLG